MTYVRAEKTQIDSWEALGNPGWNWDSLFPYYKKYESFTIPSPAQVEAGASYIASDHGELGPLTVGYAYDLQNGSLFQDAAAAWRSLGIPTSTDVNGGDVRGFTMWQATLDREANVREDAARAFYYPVESRPNLRAFLNTTAHRIVWKDSNEIVAAGVEVAAEDGTVSILKATKEVIISAGTLRSSAILELSGIGNPE
jgi:choline dehydrogenase-like flavoprotein